MLETIVGKVSTQRSMISDEYIDDVRRGFANAKKIGAGFNKRETNPAAISAEEIMALHYVFSRERENATRIAELGTFLGHTANIIADLAPLTSKIEIYDLFEQNELSRSMLRGHALYDDEDFFAVWQQNTKSNSNRFDVLRGDIIETAKQRTSGLDVLFVDVVKHASLVNVMNNVFYDRLRVGGYAMHQDYYHYQSPWLVYQMEFLEDAFALVGDFGNNMSVYIKKRELTEEEKQFDFINGLTNEEKYSLMDIAIQRHPGLRAGNLLASKLRLSIHDDTIDSNKLYEHIMRTYNNGRIQSYANTIMLKRDELDDMKW